MCRFPLFAAQCDHSPPTLQTYRQTAKLPTLLNMVVHHVVLKTLKHVNFFSTIKYTWKIYVKYTVKLISIPKMWNWQKMWHSHTSAETSACFDGPPSQSSVLGLDWSSFFTPRCVSRIISRAISSSTTQWSDDVQVPSSSVDCASASDDNKMTGRQITANAKVNLHDLDMLTAPLRACILIESACRLSYSAIWRTVCSNCE